MAETENKKLDGYIFKKTVFTGNLSKVNKTKIILTTINNKYKLKNQLL